MPTNQPVSQPASQTMFATAASSMVGRLAFLHTQKDAPALTSGTRATPEESVSLALALSGASALALGEIGNTGQVSGRSCSPMLSARPA